MEQDLAMLQSISDTLKSEPQANQRTFAKNAGMSIGLMNAVLKRFVERGWIMLSNVNGRKIAYALTASGIAELTERGKSFAKRNFAMAASYNDVLTSRLAQAKASGKTRVLLYGQSYIKFLIVYACESVGLEFGEVKDGAVNTEGALCLLGEQVDSRAAFDLTGCDSFSLIDLMHEVKV